MLVNERLSAPCYRPQTLASNLAKSQKTQRVKKTVWYEPLRAVAAGCRSRWGHSQRRGRGNRWRGTLGGPKSMVGGCAPEVPALKCRLHFLYSRNGYGEIHPFVALPPVQKSPFHFLNI